MVFLCKFVTCSVAEKRVIWCWCKNERVQFTLGLFLTGLSWHHVSWTRRYFVTSWDCFPPLTHVEEKYLATFQRILIVVVGNFADTSICVLFCFVVNQLGVGIFFTLSVKVIIYITCVRNSHNVAYGNVGRRCVKWRFSCVHEYFDWREEIDGQVAFPFLCEGKLLLELASSLPPAFSLYSCWIGLILYIFMKDKCTYYIMLCYNVTLDVVTKWPVLHFILQERRGIFKLHRKSNNM